VSKVDGVTDLLADGVVGETTVYVITEWQQGFPDYTEQFEACLREMIEVAEVGPEDIRAIFYFDS